MGAVASRCLTLPFVIYRWVLDDAKNSLASMDATQIVLDERPLHEPSVVLPLAIPKEQPDSVQLKIVDKPNPPPSRQPSPCFIESDLATIASRDERLMLMACQHLLFKSYVHLALRGVFLCGTSKAPWESVCAEGLLYHPVQDPTGALFVAMLIVRRNRPKSTSIDGRLELSIEARKSLAAIATVAHKSVAHGSGMGIYQYLRNVWTQFLLPGQLPVYEADWVRGWILHMKHEVMVISEPLHTLQTNSPFSEAEVVIEQKVADGCLSKRDALIMRGGLFFLLASALFNPVEDVLEDLAAQMDMEEIGAGCVHTLVVLLHASGAVSSASRSKKARRHTPAKSCIVHVASKLLENAIADHADHLRVGPYSESEFTVTWSALDPIHPVARLVAKSTLASAFESIKN